MPKAKTVRRARAARQKGKAPSTQAGEFVREEIHHVREGKHGARSPKQAIAIGLAKARRAGVKLPAPAKGTTSASTRRHAERDLEAGRSGARPTSGRRSAATKKALQRERHGSASHRELAEHARTANRRRSKAQRSAAARKAARTRAKSKSTK